MEKEKIRSFYKNTLRIRNEESLAYLVSHSKLVFVKRKTNIYKIGDTIDQMWFLCEGFFYMFHYKNPKRKEITSIAWNKGLPLLTSTKLKKQTSLYEIFVPVESWFVVTDFKVIQHVLETDEEAKQSYICMLEEYIKFLRDMLRMRAQPVQKRVYSFFKYYAYCAPYMVNSEIAAFLDMSRAEYVKTLGIIRNNKKEEQVD